MTVFVPWSPRAVSPPADYKRDYTVIEADFFHLIPLLAEGKADMVTSIANIRFTPQAQLLTRPLFTMEEAMGGSVQILFRVARAPYIAKNRAALVDYFEDEMRELSSPAGGRYRARMFSLHSHRLEACATNVNLCHLPCLLSSLSRRKNPFPGIASKVDPPYLFRIKIVSGSKLIGFCRRQDLPIIWKRFC